MIAELGGSLGQGGFLRTQRTPPGSATVKVLCSEKTASILCSGKYDDIMSFKWAILMEELKLHAPVLTHVLTSCTASKQPSSNRMAIICVCASVLLKYWCSRMSLFQKIVMLILYAGHCGKQVRQSCDEKSYTEILLHNTGLFKTANLESHSQSKILD